ncbi:MAG: alanyl-tRNA editing protein [Vicinamibacterales bacterium]
MTTRLYYTDALRFRFDATVRACEATDGGFAVTLDRTAFYPTSGGQPFDTGRLGGARVIDVVDREPDEVVHLVDAPLEPGTTVEGEVDATRRFDHMQQHTGQHVLSAAFERTCGVATTSFHLGAETATIDLAREVSADEVARAEAEACRVVFENHPVTVRFVGEAEAADLPLRKESKRTGTLRLVEIADVDLSACGGTHVPETGRIGLIAVAGWERFKGATRVTFVCGGRARRSHGRLRDVVAAGARVLSVAGDDLPASVERLLADTKALQRQVKRQGEELAVSRAARSLAEAETSGAVRVVLRAEPDLDAGGLKALASAIVQTPGCVVVLVGGGGDGAPAPVVAARSADVGWDAGAWVKAAAAATGGRGGGRPEFAQGGLPAPAATILSLARADLDERASAGA